MITVRTALSVLGLSLASSLLLLASGPPAGQTPAADLYKAGPIRLDPDPAFGKDTDWNLLFFNHFCDLTVAPDGSIFIASSREHRIYKFDPRGSLVKAFGQKGQGPGDFNGPGDLSVLDGKYLVVGEFATNLRISLFDLEGKFDRILATKRPYYSPVALREGKIAYVVFNYRGEGQGATQVIHSVVIRAIDGPREIKVAEHTFGWGGILLKPGGSMSFGDSLGGRTFIAATKDGNLLVGNSLQPFIEVFSPEGTKISTIDLGLDPVTVTKEYRARYKDFQIGRLRRELGYSQWQSKETLKQVENASFDHLFAEVLPLYREILVDAEGNLLVFRKTECLGDCPILVRVYSPEGKFVCETEILEGAFSLAVDNRIKNMSFGGGGLLAMVEVKDAEDPELRLIRVNHRRPPR